MAVWGEFKKVLGESVTVSKGIIDNGKMLPESAWRWTRWFPYAKIGDEVTLEKGKWVCPTAEARRAEQDRIEAEKQQALRLNISDYQHLVGQTVECRRHEDTRDGLHYNTEWELGVVVELDIDRYSNELYARVQLVNGQVVRFCHIQHKSIQWVTADFRPLPQVEWDMWGKF